MDTFLQYCRDYIKDNIHDYVGQDHYASDLSYTLTQGPNANGTLTFNRHDAMEYLREWWWDCADYFDWEVDNLGCVRNPFDNPEAYMVCMVIEGVNILISQCSFMDEHGDGLFELTAEIADSICSEIDDLEIKF